MALALLAGAAPGTARADSSVIVLSVRAVDGDDDLAHRLSDALRRGAAWIEGWQVSDREVSLAQMSLAHGCSEPSANCMADIAKTLEVDRLLYGTSEHVDGGIAVSLHNFDAVTGHVEHDHGEVLPEAALTPGAIEDTAKRLALYLAGAVPTGNVEVTADLPTADVQLDGKPMGQVDADGRLLLEGVPAGDHVVEISGAGERQQREVSVREGDTAVVSVQLVPEPVAVPEPAPPESVAPLGDGEDASRGKGLMIGGWVAVGLAGGLLAGTAATWARIEAINNDRRFEMYRGMFGPEQDVCQLARAGNAGDQSVKDIAAHVADLCDKGERLEKLQWGLLAGSIAAAGTGITLLVLDRLRRRDDRAQLTLSPLFARSGGGLQAHLRF